MKSTKLSFLTLGSIRELLESVSHKISHFEENLNNLSFNRDNRYYRNKDLKRIFGFSDKTIQSYRETNILPYTYIGEIYFYPIDEVKQILENNSNFKLLQN